jgi:hypothetical protein
MNEFNLFDRLLISAALKVIATIVLGSLCGCAQRTDGATVGSLDTAIAIVQEVDQSMTRPELPDCLAEKETVSTQAAPLQRVVVYAPAWCSGCGPKVAALQKALGERFAFELHDDARTFPAWTATVGGVYPLIEWRVDKSTTVKTWFYINDYSTPEDFERRYLKTATPAAAGGRDTTGGMPARRSYPMRSSAHWSIAGDWNPSRSEVLNHLLHGDKHQGRHSRRELEKMNREQLLALHDADHEGRRYAAAAPHRGTSCPTCPGGRQ